MTGSRLMSPMNSIRRSPSWCLELTRMWRSTARASLEKKPSMRLSHDPCVGVNVKVKRPMGRGRSGCETTPFRSASEGRRHGLGRAKSSGHQPGRRGIEGGVEGAAYDRRRAVPPAVDPLQKLLHLKEPQRIIAARHVEVGHIEIDRPLLDQDAGDQRDDVAGLIIEIASFDDWKPGQQR